MDSLFAPEANQTVKHNSISIRWRSARVNVICVTLRRVTLHLAALNDHNLLPAALPEQA